MSSKPPQTADNLVSMALGRAFMKRLGSAKPEPSINVLARNEMKQDQLDTETSKKTKESEQWEEQNKRFQALVKDFNQLK